jgi:hypothetical protein
MGFFYFDESIHKRGDFSLGVFVFSYDPLDMPVGDVLVKSGLKPGADEFKSSSRMDQCPAQSLARSLLNSVVLERCGIGVVVAPLEPRPSLGIEAIKGLGKILSTTKFRNESHEVFFDKGIFKSVSAGERAVAGERLAQLCRFHFEQNSVRVLGLQVADLVSHTCATMLLSQLGLVNKRIKAGENSGYDPESEMPLEFGLWAGLRYNFFAEPPPSYETWKSQNDFRVNVASRGLHVAETCSPKVKKAAMERFGSMYLGCIH